MASIENYRLHDVEPVQDDYRVVQSNFDEYRYTIQRTNGEPGDIQIGEPITVIEHFSGAEPSDNTYSFTYYGRDANGMMVGSGSTEYYFSPTDYPADTVLTAVDEPYPVCFVKGSQIVTRRGAIAIESLVPGDLVQTRSGWGTVKWVGWRHYAAPALRTASQKLIAAPVRIRADAVAPNVPSSDLLVSPWHHLLVEGQLIRANDLINGVTVTQELSATAVDYYHIELEQFDVLMAHGIYSESWADGGNRSFFQNADVTTLRPEESQRRRASRPGYDHLVLRKGKRLDAIKSRMAKRANEFGAATDHIAKAA